MIELRFHRDLYDGFAVDEAAKVYGTYAAMDLAREPETFVVRVTASPETIARGIDERTLCAEMSNYALGLSIEKASQTAAAGVTTPEAPR